MQAGGRWLRALRSLSARLRGPEFGPTFECKVPGAAGCVSPYLCYPSSYATIRLGAHRNRCFYDRDTDETPEGGQDGGGRN